MVVSALLKRAPPSTSPPARTSQHPDTSKSAASKPAASKSEALLLRRAAAVANGVPLGSRAAISSGSGAILTDLDGRRIIDLASGIGVVGTGHCPPSVVEAIVRQAGLLIHTCIQIGTYEPYVALCERLIELLPHGEHTKAMLVNSGAEAVENAVKIARQATDRPAVVCFTGAFHGRTLLGMSLTSKVKYKIRSGPFAPEIYRLPFPDHFHEGDGLDEDAFSARELARLEESLLTVVSAVEVAAIIVEPVLGEGGFVPAPKPWLEGLRRLCDRHGILLIFDEVQTGFGRTGHFGAYQHFGVTPDLSTWAKALGGGLPISAVVGKADVMDAARPGTIGGTYGGNPVACAAALANIDLIESLGLCARALEIGTRIRRHFEALQAQTTTVVDVRGVGAMIAMELCLDGDLSRPAGQMTRDVLAACLEQGVLVVAAGVHGNMIRILCPLIIDFEHLEQGLTVLCLEVLRRTA
ncbi:MAG: 4-aminobutyrate aminotransferase/(S)-3-amino-2-methylpropionate transaminase [Bradymonadia bacterium]|jgi:4-aminobutyrate aminotransferase/(S)-3-amino-2-methylpropionate transaminase